MSKALKFYLVTDTHYYAMDTLGVSEHSDQKCMNESGAIIDAAFNKIIAQNEIDILLIAGDLTNNGEMESHKGFIEKLSRLKTAGKRVYVITATHDYGLRELKDGDTVGEEDGRACRSQLRGMYNEFGFNEAIAEYSDGLSRMASAQSRSKINASCSNDAVAIVSVRSEPERRGHRRATVFAGSALPQLALSCRVHPPAWPR